MDATSDAVSRLTLRIPEALVQQLDEERVRVSAELQTRLSLNQFLERTLRRGLAQR